MRRRHDVTGASREACDDGNTVTESSCDYGTATCLVCSSTCSLVATTGSVCGDGVVDAPFESCDDRNTDACGSCSSDCRTIQLARATGLIVAIPAADIVDGTTLTIGDGLGTTVVFEFDKDATSSGVPIALNGTEDASSVAIKISNAINAASLRIDAVSTSALLQLTHQSQTSLGNIAISETVPDPDFYVAGMAGGEGGDCGAGVGCASDADCASGVCGLTSPWRCE